MSEELAGTGVDSGEIPVGTDHSDGKSVSVTPRIDSHAGSWEPGDTTENTRESWLRGEGRWSVFMDISIRSEDSWGICDAESLTGGRKPKGTLFYIVRRCGLTICESCRDGYEKHELRRRNLKLSDKTPATSRSVRRRKVTQ